MGNKNPQGSLSGEFFAITFVTCHFNEVSRGLTTPSNLQDESLLTHQKFSGGGCVGPVGLSAHGHNAVSGLRAARSVRLYSMRGPKPPPPKMSYLRVSTSKPTRSSKILVGVQIGNPSRSYWIGSGFDYTSGPKPPPKTSYPRVSGERRIHQRPNQSNTELVHRQSTSNQTINQILNQCTGNPPAINQSIKY